jgi:hypothetical protein
MSRNMMLAVGACLLLFGLLVGYMAGSGGPDVAEIDAAVAARIEAAGKAEAERVAALEAKVDALSSRLDGIATEVTSGSDTLKGVGEKLGTDVAGLAETLRSDVATASDRLGSAIRESATSQLAALESGIAALRGNLAARVAAPQPAPPASEPPPADLGQPPAGQGAGETALLADGALRVFVSRVDEGSARLVVNGSAVDLATGESRTLELGGEDCQVTLAAIDRGHVVVAGGCGDELPQPEGAGPGSTVTLGDGAVRVFVSSVDESGASIAINGVERQTVPVGESVTVPVGDAECEVSVEGIDRGRVVLGYACG